MACGRLEMDGGKGGEVHGVERMKGRERDGSMCGWNMDDKIVGGRIGFFDSCWKNCHIKLGDRRIFQKGTHTHTHTHTLFATTKRIHKKLPHTQKTVLDTHPPYKSWHIL